MERIRQALEQANIDREKAGVERHRPNMSAPVTPGQVIPDQPAPQFQAPQTPQAPKVAASDVVYTETRSINVSRQTMVDNHLVAAIDGHELQDNFRILRTQIMKEMRANNWNMIAVTSPHNGAGKSTTAINLAIALAMDISHTVVLVDADLRNPSIHKYFGYEPEVGLSDYLQYGTDLKDVLFHPPIDRLTVLPGREEVSNSAELLGSPQANQLAQELKTRYDDRLVVVDLPPLLSSDDVMMSDTYIDCVLMVTESGVTKRRELTEAFRVLKNVPVIGTVLNKVPRPKKLLKRS